MIPSRWAAPLLTLACAYAHAEPPVVLYGVVDAGIKVDNGASPGPAWSLSPNNRLGSRLGLRGAEALGAGLRAVFTLEAGFNPDDGALSNGGRPWGRQAWVGLESPLGTVQAGRQYSATYLALRAIDPFKNQEAGDAQRTFGYGIAKLDPIARADNGVSYTSPALGGWQLRGGIKLGEAAAGFRANGSRFVDLYRDTGPWVVHASLQDSEDVALGATAAQLGALVGKPAVAASTVRVRNAFAGLVYDAGAVRLHAGYGATTLSALRDVRIRNHLLGATLPLAGGVAIASWNRLAVGGLADGIARQKAVGYAHRLGKRTELYTSASWTANGRQAALNTTAAGRSARELRAGMCHGF
jgi:predicted porin